MKKTNHTLLLHPFFTGCLFVLLLNDFILKYQYHNWLTGKLSDFAGIAAFVIFFSSFIPQKKKWVYIITAIAFLWWKSPLSQTVINFCNTALHIPVSRIVDYTDYAALSILIVSWRLQPVSAVALYKKIAVYFMGFVSVFAFCATEAPRYMQAKENYVNMHDDYKTTLTEHQVLQRLDSMHINYTRDSIDIASVYLSGGNFYYTQKDTLTDSVKYIEIPKDGFTKLYKRSYTLPYISINNFIINGDTIPKIKIRIEESYNKKWRYVHFFDITLSNKTFEDYINKPGTIRRDYKKLIYDNIIKKLL